MSALSSLYSCPAWFSQITKPGFSFAGQIVPPSSPAISKATGGYLCDEICREYLAQSLQSIGFVLALFRAAEKLLSNLPRAKTSVQSPAAMRRLLPEMGQGHACIVPTLGVFQPSFR